MGYDCGSDFVLMANNRVGVVKIWKYVGSIKFIDVLNFTML
jgi:hypothetical protein